MITLIEKRGVNNYTTNYMTATKSYKCATYPKEVPTIMAWEVEAEVREECERRGEISNYRKQEMEPLRKLRSSHDVSTRNT